MPGQSRRKSVIDRTATFQARLQGSLDELTNIWDRIGFEEPERVSRISQAYGYLENLLADMIQEEKDSLLALNDKIDDYQQQIDMLHRELGRPPVQIPHEMTPIKLAEYLTSVVNEMKVEKRERMDKAKELRTRDESLCSQMLMTPFYVPTDVVPSDKQMKDLMDHIEYLNTELTNRKATLQESRNRIRSLYRKMNKVPPEGFAEDLVNFDEDSFLLSSKQMQDLQNLKDELEEEYVVYREKVRELITQAKSELEVWWNKCLVGQEGRNAVPTIDEENFSEDALDLYRNEATKWKAYYEKRREIFDKVTEWETLWANKVDFERSQNDPSRYNNRAGNLERALKEARKVERMLPYVKKELVDLVMNWRDSNPSDPLTINGCDPLDHLRAVQSHYEASKEVERNKKKQQKERENIEASRFGTPHLMNSRNASPARTVGVGPQFKTPSRGQRTPLKPAQMSANRAGASPRMQPYFGKSPSTSRLQMMRSPGPNVANSCSLTRSPMTRSAAQLNHPPTWRTNNNRLPPSVPSSPSSYKVRAGTKRNAPLEQTLDEREFKSGNFHTSSFVSLRSTSPPAGMNDH